MMTFLLILMLGSDTQTEAMELKIPSHLRRPIVTWIDLDGDDILDIWVREGSSKAPDQKGTYWVYSGAWKDSEFKPVHYEEMKGRIRPVGDGDTFWARTYDRGIILDYVESGWVPRADFTQYDRVRPGMAPIELGSSLLVPTFSGYQMLQGDCLQATFSARPAVEVSSRKLKLTWPMPRLRDLDGDGHMDLVAAPVRSPQHGTARVWYALRRGDGWQEGSSQVQFPSNAAVAGYQFGDMDGDNIPEMMIMTRPNEELSIFEEMGFHIFTGTDIGQWEQVPTQILKTKQNLWQNGPVEMDEHGITFYYYKGLIRDKFKIDRFPFQEGGYVAHKPVSLKWKLKDANRSLILLDHDLNEDGAKDLVLSDERGMLVFHRKKGTALPFAETPDVTLKAGRNLSGRSFEVTFGDDSSFKSGYQGIAGRIKGKGSALVKGHGKNGPSLWRLKQEDDGFWYLRQHNLSEASTTLASTHRR